MKNLILIISLITISLGMHAKEKTTSNDLQHIHTEEEHRSYNHGHQFSGPFIPCRHRSTLTGALFFHPQYLLVNGIRRGYCRWFGCRRYADYALYNNYYTARSYWYDPRTRYYRFALGNNIYRGLNNPYLYPGGININGLSQRIHLNSRRQRFNRNLNRRLIADRRNLRVQRQRY